MLRYVNGDFESVELKFKPDMSKYHAVNGGYMSEVVKAYIDRTGNNGNEMPKDFIKADIYDLYGLSIERCGGRLDCFDLILTGILAGVAMSERMATA